MRRALVLAALVLPLCACGTKDKVDAAVDVRALLVAVRQNDHATFERHVDRPALRQSVAEQLNARLASEAGPYGGLLDGLADRAADELIRPEAFKIAIEQSGLPDRTPSAAEIAVLLKPAGEGRLCLEDARTHECALTFDNVGGVWKLSAVKVSETELVR